jgi:hypothetical protein
VDSACQQEKDVKEKKKKKKGRGSGPEPSAQPKLLIQANLSNQAEPS